MKARGHLAGIGGVHAAVLFPGEEEDDGILRALGDIVERRIRAEGAVLRGVLHGAEFGDVEGAVRVEFNAEHVVDADVRDDGAGEAGVLREECAHEQPAISPALDGELLVQGTDHHFRDGPRAYLLGMPLGVFARGFKERDDPVRRDEVARKNPGDLPLPVQRDIQQEARPDAQRDVAHLLPDRIPLGDAKCAAPVSDVLCAMIAHHGLQRRDAGHDALRPDAESREEMRLDEAGDDPHVGLGEMPVDQRRRARSRDAELHMRIVVLRLVIDAAVIRDDRGREHLLHLRLRV